MKPSLFLIALSFFAFSAPSFAQAPAQPTASDLFQNGAILANFYWEKGPVSSMDGSESILRAEFLNSSTHTPIALTSAPNISAWMQMGGMWHGTSPAQIVPVTSAGGTVLPGVYRVSKIYFVMSGKWQMRTKLTNSSGASETETFDINVP